MSNKDSMLAKDMKIISENAKPTDVFEIVNNKIRFAAAAGSMKCTVRINGNIDKDRVIMYYRNLGYSIGVMPILDKYDLYIDWSKAKY